MKTTTKISLIWAAMLATGISNLALAGQSDCNKPFGAELRICKIVSFQVIAHKGISSNIAAKGGTNTFDIILYTNDVETGGQKRLAEMSYFDRDYDKIPRNGYVLNGGRDFLNDWYKINAHHRQFEGVRRMLEEGKTPEFQVYQRGPTSTVRGHIRVAPQLVQ